MNYLQKNYKKQIIGNVLLSAILYISISNGKQEMPNTQGVGFIVFVNFLFWFSFQLPIINSYRMIKRISTDTTQQSVISIFDNGYTITYEHEKTWLLMARPRITATISGLPLTIYYEPGAQKTKPEVHYQIYPLSDENSRHILGTDVIVQLTWLSRKISRDVKPELLQCVANANARHITSGIGRPRAKGRVEMYEK